MSAWVVVPCLLVLRDEFNALSPKRDKGADGTIGDSAHTSSSDHTPDEDSDVLRDHDADDKNEVHALDIDSSGPWPPGRTFHEIVMDVIADEKAKWLDPNDRCRLKYVIWDHKIYSTNTDFAPVKYTGTDPHTNHAHFSARYETACENDTRPWGVKGDDMGLTSDDVKKVWTTDEIVAAPKNAASYADNPFWAPASFLTDAAGMNRDIKAQTNLLPAMSESIRAIGVTVQVIAQTQKIDQAVTAKLEAALAALSTAVDNVDEATAAQIFGGSNEQIAAAFATALGARADEVAELILARK